MDCVGLGAALTLAHWRGMAVHAPPRDTSAGSALRALHRSETLGLEAQVVTANQFNTNGFVGVWALLSPALALHHEELLGLAPVTHYGCTWWA